MTTETFRSNEHPQYQYDQEIAAQISLLSEKHNIIFPIFEFQPKWIEKSEDMPL